MELNMIKESLTKMPLMGYQITYDNKQDGYRQWS